MNINDRIKYAREKGKESADKLFKEKPEEIKKILEEETTLGRPENLLDRSDEREPNETVITYVRPEEIAYLQHYAGQLGDDLVYHILNRGFVTTPEEAEHLSRFFWRMVDRSIEDEKQSLKLPWLEKAEFWNEKTMRSLSGYLERAGYEAVWARVSDEQDE